MLNDKCGVTDEVLAAVGYGRGPNDGVGIRGHVVAELRDRFGNLKQREETHNLVTTVGDNYSAARFFSNTPAFKTFYMKTGTTATAPAKSNDDAFIGDAAYNPHSVAGMESGWPKVGATNKVAQFKSAWTNDADHAYTVRRVELTDDSGNAAEEGDGNSYAIALFGADIVKASTDTLTITWNITFLGA
jgi:hypothetical protein